MNDAVLSLLQRTRSATVVVVVTALITGWATLEAVSADRDQRAALASLQPIVDAASRLGAFLLSSARVVLPSCGLILAVAAIGVSLWIGRTRGWSPSVALWAMTGLAFGAQAAWLVGWPRIGLAVAAGCVAVAVVGRPRDARDDRFGSAADERLRPIDAALLSACIAAAALMRFYALNRVPQIFEGELAPFMVGAIDLRGMWFANAGVQGPWSPLGMLYYLPIHAMVAIAGPTVLAVRLASVVVSIATIPIGAVLAREVGGRSAAILTAAVLAIDPLQVGWGRTDVYPHSATTWPALLLAFATLRMVRTGATRWFAAVAVLMSLTWHQYPSGQFAVLMPPMVIAAAFLFDRRRVLRWGWRPAMVAVGLDGWLAGFSFTEWLATGRWVGFGDYVHRLGSRLEGQQGPESIAHYVLHLAQATADLAIGIWYGVPRLFHQTFLPETPGLTVRSLPWAVAALAIVGLLALVVRPRRDASWVLVGLVATSILPAVLSDLAYVKRAAVLYPTLEIIAAVTAASLVHSVTEGRRRAVGVSAVGAALVVALWMATACHLWFSGQRYPWGRPAEEVLAEAVEAEVGPGDLVIASFWDHYMDGKLSFLLTDRFRTGSPPPAWFISRPGIEHWPRLASEPDAVLDLLDPPPWYWRWAGLDRYNPQPEWRSGRVVYLLQDHAEIDRQLASVCEACPGARTLLLRPINAEPKHEMWLVVCDPHPSSFTAPRLPSVIPASAPAELDDPAQVALPGG